MITTIERQCCKFHLYSCPQKIKGMLIFYFAILLLILTSIGIRTIVNIETFIEIIWRIDSCDQFLIF